MGKLLARYVGKDLGKNYDGDIVEYLKQFAAMESIHYFREAVFSVPGKVESRFQEVLELDKLRSSRGEIPAVLLARSLTHKGLKKKVNRYFEKESIPIHALYDHDIKRIINSPSVCEYISFSSMWSVAAIRKMYTRNSDNACINHFIDSLIKYNSGLKVAEAISSLTNLKPSLIQYMSEQRLRHISDENILRILSSWDRQSTIRYIIDYSVSFDREAVDYIGQIISMKRMSGDNVPHTAVRVFRLLGS